MKKNLTFVKYSVVLISSMMIINQYSTMITQANPLSKLSNHSKTMNESEIAIIKDIKQACIDVASQSISLESLAAKFGTPAKNSMNSNEVEPFNINLNSVHVSVGFDSKDPSVADTVDFNPKPGKISIETLRQEFGDYFHGVPSGPSVPETVVFNAKVILHNGKEKNCDIFVSYRRDEDRFQRVDVKNENIEDITVRFRDYSN
jgi:hypothetical protein